MSKVVDASNLKPHEASHIFDRPNLVISFNETKFNFSNSMQAFCACV